MKRHVAAALLTLSMYLPSVALADSCVMPINELQAGVVEADLGNVKIKTEVYNKIAKMKLISSVNEDWTSVSTESEAGQITGFIGNGADAKLAAHLVIRQIDAGFEWAVYKPDGNGRSGTAYFFFNNKAVCAATDLATWKRAVEKIMGSNTNIGVINVSNDVL